LAPFLNGADIISFGCPGMYGSEVLFALVPQDCVELSEELPRSSRSDDNRDQKFQG